MNREHSDVHQSVTIDPKGLLCVWGRAVDTNKPFVILRHEGKEFICFVTSETNVNRIHL